MRKKASKTYLNTIKDTSITILIFMICTAICYLLYYFKINDLNFLIIYVLGILLTAVFTKGLIYSTALSIISVFGYNFFFTVPRYTFHFTDSKYLVTFILMFLVGFGISLVTYQLKKRMMQVSNLNIEKMNLKNEADKELMKATLLRSMSHDLRTPLTTIKNGAEIIRDCSNIEETDKNEILSDIILKSEWTIRLIQNLMSLTHIDSTSLTVKKTAEAIEEVIPQAIRNVNGVLKDRIIHYELPTEMLLVPMDATLIMQVIGNILNNAATYTAEDGNIWIQVWNTGKNAMFRISNDGAAIKEEDLSHIFEMYYTSGDSKKEGSNGLGLAICKLIVTAHGGQIEARQANNRAIFEFSLPMEV